MDRFLYIGVDIGGTKIKVGVVDNLGKVVCKESIYTANNLDEHQIIKTLARMINQLKNLYPTVIGVGIGCAGIIDYTKGLIIFSPNIGWKNFPLVSRLQELIKLNIVLDNDANAATLGTFLLEYANKYSQVMCVTLGTGVGGGLILNGTLYRGKNTFAGEVGHMKYIPGGELCSCGKRGCIEAYTGTKAVLKMAHKEISKNPSSLIPNFKEQGKVTPLSISNAAKLGDNGAKAIWKQIGSHLGIVFSSVINLLNIEVIHITGGLAQAEEWLAPAIDHTVAKHSFYLPKEDSVSIVFSKRKKDIGLVGSGLLVLERYQSHLLPQ